MPAPMPDRPARILETSLYAADLDAAEAFYGGVLGLERAARGGDRHVFFRLAGAMLLIFNPAETERPLTGSLPVPTHGARGPGHLALAASAADLDRLARAPGRGRRRDRGGLPLAERRALDLRARPRRQLRRAHRAGPLGLRPRLKRDPAPRHLGPNTQSHHHHTRARLRAPTRPRGGPAPSPWLKYAIPPSPHASPAPTPRHRVRPRPVTLAKIRSRRRRTRKGGVRAAGGRAGRRERRPASGLGAHRDASGARITAAASSGRR